MAKKPKSSPQVPPVAQTEGDKSFTVFAMTLGALFGLAMVKFGNPVVMENLIIPPKDAMELVFAAWPLSWGNWLLLIVLAVGIRLFRWQKTFPKWLVFLPVIWLVWTLISGGMSINSKLSFETTTHYATCAIGFYLGLCVLGRSGKLGLFWLFILIAFGVVIQSGFSQHFGGLAASRKYFLTYVYPDAKDLSPEYLKKLASNRIFSTLFYPNALAGVILLWLPPLLAAIWSATEWFTREARLFIIAVVVGGALACLYWSGSKGGWLLLLMLGIVWSLFLPFPKKLKTGLVLVVLMVGLTGFFVKYAGFFKKGATSVVARFDYWEAALKTAAANPVFGSGPGTFGEAYAKIKRPESEMARVAHNDYLEQASDSGIIAFASFTCFVCGGLVYIFRNCTFKADGLNLCMWLGLLGWAAQSTMEFGLFIPALSWPAFCMMGWLISLAATSPNAIDRASQRA